MLNTVFIHVNISCKKEKKKKKQGHKLGEMLWILHFVIIKVPPWLLQWNNKHVDEKIVYIIYQIMKELIVHVSVVVIVIKLLTASQPVQFRKIP